MSVFLLVLSTAVVLLFVARWLKAKKPAGERSQRRKQPSLSKGASRRSRSGRFDLNPIAGEDLNLQGGEQADALSSTNSLSNAETDAKEAPSDLIVVHAMADPSKPYQGYDLLQALLANNLRFGERKIFHRHDVDAKPDCPLYSVASLNKPGTFDLPKMGAFSCDGLIFFMELKGLKDPVGALQILLDGAEKLIATLGGHLADETRALLSTEAVARMREQAAYYACSNRASVVNE
jgi:cell division protein ZipA